MSYCTDADLLAYEPNVFVDLPFASQRTLRIADGVVAGATLTSETGGFGALDEGDVVVLGVETPYAVAVAVAEVVDDHTLALAGSPVKLGSTAELAVEARTFAPQAMLVHDELMRTLGLDPDDPAASAATILGESPMCKLEALGTLAFIYAAAIVPGGDNRAIDAKSRAHRGAFQKLLRTARILVDTDGDGEADETRTLGVARLVRE